VADHVADRFGVRADCRTADEPLPGSEDFAVLRDYMDEFGLRSPIGRRSVERLGSRAETVLDTDDPNPVVCGCEAVTRAEVRDAIGLTGSDDAPGTVAGAGADLNAVRIRTRASMGNCQGGFCTHRMAAELHPEFDAPTVRQAHDDLFEERWKGQRHALWGRQLTQAAINYALHATTMNHDGDPVRRDESVDFAAFDGGPPDADSSAGAAGSKPRSGSGADAGRRLDADATTRPGGAEVDRGD